MALGRAGMAAAFAEIMKSAADLSTINSSPPLSGKRSASGESGKNEIGSQEWGLDFVLG
jgi:hypothetical protein